MPSQVEICNRALQKLGQRRIVDITEGSVASSACLAAYDACLLAELRKHPWNFAIKRAELAAVSPAPTWGRANAFQLPSDFLRLLGPYPEDNLNDLDFQIESGQILTDQDSPIYIRYIALVSDPNQMDSLFREALATRMAVEMCEELTQSNAKKDSQKDDYKLIIQDAKRVNAFESVPIEPAMDTWESVRQ